jgi:hypothetical protein
LELAPRRSRANKGDIAVKLKRDAATSDEVVPELATRFSSTAGADVEFVRFIR